MKHRYEPLVGLYIRLSKDDLRQGESLSVENQRIFLNNYAREQGWSNVTEYVDDGYTGVNFDRPAFKRMMEDVKKKKINIIVCKDMSRFGRNYIQVGEFTDYILPSAGCHLIALNDGVDTRQKNDNDMTPFRNLFNEFYCRDISKKVLTGRSIRCKSGKFLGSYAPLGYKLNPDDRYSYLVDEKGAEIVQRIFKMRISGFSVRAIAKALNDDKVTPPRDYWYEQRNQPNPRVSNHSWTDVTIRQILTNEAYIGNMVQNKTGHISYKNKKVINKPEDEWIRVEGTHPAIIDIETWNAVQKSFDQNKIYRTNADGQMHLFSGLVRCADCGRSMKGARDSRRAGDNKVNYQCSGYTSGGTSVCSMHYIREGHLIEIVKQDILKHAKAIAFDEEAVRADLIARKEREFNANIYDARRILAENKARVTDLDSMIDSLYEEHLLRKIPDETFSRLLQKYQDERHTLLGGIEQYENTVHDSNREIANIECWIELIKEYAGYEQLDRPLLLSLIDKVIIGENYTVNGEKKRDVRIIYNFVGEISES